MKRVNILGTLRRKRKRRKRARPQVDPSKLILSLPAQDATVESYRALRTNLQFLSSERPLKTVLITSASPSVGKSVTAANLAIAVAQTGKRTLLVDSDLRRPVQHELFSLSNGYSLQDGGLTHFLVGLHPSPAYKQPLEDIEELSVFASGPIPPNPSELLSSHRAREYFAGLSEQFDFVVIDTPPVLVAADATAVAPMADGVLLVVSSMCRHPSVRKVQETLTRVNARVIGAVYNGVPRQPIASYYNYHSGYSC